LNACDTNKQRLQQETKESEAAAGETGAAVQKKKRARKPRKKEKAVVVTEDGRQVVVEAPRSVPSCRMYLFFLVLSACHADLRVEDGMQYLLLVLRSVHAMCVVFGHCCVVRLDYVGLSWSVLGRLFASIA
jgi:hypothetical protein